ncbi:MAG: hypothetical protein KUG77_20925, partial [Nannocystaceae bacterium]|nr:hypothetical protein [Nannocystaceae bacterium]
MLVLGIAWGLALTPPVEVRWSGDCEPGDAVEVAVGAELGAPRAEARWVAVDVEVAVEEVEAGVAAEVLLRTESGVTARSLEASSCEELHQAVGLLVAIHVDPYGSPYGSPEPEPEPEAEPELELELVVPVVTTSVEQPEDRTPPPAATPVVPPAFEPERGVAFLRAGVGLTMGLLSRAAPSFLVAGGWSRGHLRLEGQQPPHFVAIRLEVREVLVAL